MDGKRFRLGAVVVLLSVVMLCTAVLAVLTAVTANGDACRAEQYGSHVERVYACQSAGEEWLARADAYAAGLEELPENTEEADGVLTTRITADGIALDIAARRTDSGVQILRWDCTTLWQPEDEWNLLK